MGFLESGRLSTTKHSVCKNERQMWKAQCTTKLRSISKDGKKYVRGGGNSFLKELLCFIHKNRQRKRGTFQAEFRASFLPSKENTAFGGIKVWARSWGSQSPTLPITALDVISKAEWSFFRIHITLPACIWKASPPVNRNRGAEAHPTARDHPYFPCPKELLYTPVKTDMAMRAQRPATTLAMAAILATETVPVYEQQTEAQRTKKEKAPATPPVIRKARVAWIYPGTSIPMVRQRKPRQNCHRPACSRPTNQ